MKEKVDLHISEQEEKREDGASSFDSGTLCLHFLLSYHGIRSVPDQIYHEFSSVGGGLDLVSLVRAARKNGLKAKAIKTRIEKLANLSLPAIAELKDGSFLIVAKMSGDSMLIQRAGRAPQELKREDFEKDWSGHLILLARRAGDITTDLKFGLRWFIPVMAKYKKLFSEVLLASFFLQSFALVTPLFFQVIIDKVLVHRGLSTLDVLIVGLIGIMFFDALLGFLRTYIFSHTTSRVDVQLGSHLFRHLLALPISYFESRPTGQTVARVRELDSVREFLTSSALTVVIDLFFSIIFFVVMWLFSPKLTLIVLGSIPFYVLISIMITPELRRRVEERFYRGAINHAFLVESISGAETLKAMAVEPQMRSRWDENLAAFVQSSFRTVMLGAAGSHVVMLVNKVTTALILWFGAILVTEGELTVGQLVAFNMLAGQVSQPIMRLAQLWQEFQQFRISIQRLGDILNTKTENLKSSSPEDLPSIRGHIVLERVTFRYRVGEQEVLRDVSLEIKAGQKIGIVGKSGSGKSTVTKLIQRLHVPENGRVLVDGLDIGLLDPSWLRRQVGVVLQDNVLFNRSVRDNIAFADSAMPMKRVIRASELAGAHEFILRLPKGYDTLLEERGANLSGGQRQRIAIARALAIAPRILILDEATAALDYESERIFQKNLKGVAKGRTVIIVAHRLSTVRDCDRILVMDDGQIVEDGKHADLVEGGGIYADLIKQDRGE